MKNQFLSLTLCAFFGLGAAIAAQAPQDQPAAQQDPQANGQHNERRPADPNRQLQFLTKKLNLSSDQQSRLLPILTDRQQQMAAIRSENSLSSEERRTK